MMPSGSAPAVPATARLVPEPGGGLDVVYVLCLMQVVFQLLAGLGEELLMGGDPRYLVLPLVKVVLVLVFASRAVKGRAWAMVGLIVLQAVTLTGFGIQMLAGLLPAVDFTVNLVGLLTTVALPLAVVWLCARQLAALRRYRVVNQPTDPVPQDPYLPGMADRGLDTVRVTR